MNRLTALFIGITAAVAILAVAAYIQVTAAEASLEQPEPAASSAAQLMAANEAAGVVPVISSNQQQAPAASSSGPAGIWVSGEGKISVTPDLAILNLGVESQAATVSEANIQATVAMEAILHTLRDTAVKSNDIQTRRFNIYPNYDYIEEVVDGRRTSRRTLTGYTVSNNTAVKIRDLDSIGRIIDAVVAAGGDDVRVDGINFTVEDTEPLMTSLREMAVKDALQKAAHLANLSGVELGKLVYISDATASPPLARGYAEYGYAGSPLAASISTPISGGETEVSLQVQAGFSIN